jgi:hypothetical protein
MSDDATKHWPKYRSHKVVQAAKIVSIHHDLGEGPYFLWVDPGTGNLEKFTPTELKMLDHAEVGGYAVVYEDGYRSITPKAPFDDGYTLIGVEA